MDILEKLNNVLHEAKIKIADIVHQKDMKFGNGKVVSLKGNTARVKFKDGEYDINVDDLIKIK